MNAKQLIASGLALALMSMAAPAVASGPGGHGPGDGAGGFPGLPDQALFGICNAFGHADDNATSAPPFAWLTSAMCDDASHPAEDRGDDERGDEDEADRRGPPR